MPLGAISNHVIFRARAPRYLGARLVRLRQLSNGFGVFPLSRPAQHGPSARRDCSRHGAREYAAISPLSRVIAAAFPLASEYDTASSPARDHTCVCVCFISCDRLPYTAYVESPALAWCLYQVPIVSQSYEYLPPPPCFRWIARPSRLTRLLPPRVYSSRVSCPPGAHPRLTAANSPSPQWPLLVPISQFSRTNCGNK